jgi:hypothetical protein
MDNQAVELHLMGDATGRVGKVAGARVLAHANQNVGMQVLIQNKLAVLLMDVYGKQKVDGVKKAQWLLV